MLVSSIQVVFLSILVGGSGCAETTPQPLAASSATPRLSTTTAREQEPETMAETWLRLNDAERFSESWADCAAAFKQKLDAGAFEKVFRASRPAGTVQSRTKTSVKLFASVPGKPDGHYARVVFETVFSEDGTVLETVWLSQEPPDRWRVQGSRLQRAFVE